MNKESLKIIFAGTPLFAVAALDILIRNNFHLVGIITAPDRPSGRGQEIHQTEVKKYACKLNIPIFQPEKLGDPVFLKQLEALDPDLQIVVAFRMMPEKLWSMPRLGTFNLHASLLPQYRGAAPINHVLINGEKETGVTTFFLRHEIDTGDILFQERIPIGENETAGELHDKLMRAGAQLVLKTTTHILSGNYPTISQQELTESAPLKPAPKIFKENCRINWDSNTHVIYNFIRGLCPYPAAWSEIMDPNGKRYTLKIFKVLPVEQEHQHIGND